MPPKFMPNRQRNGIGVMWLILCLFGNTRKSKNKISLWIIFLIFQLSKWINLCVQYIFDISKSNFYQMNRISYAFWLLQWKAFVQFYVTSLRCNKLEAFHEVLVSTLSLFLNLIFLQKIICDVFFEIAKMTYQYITESFKWIWFIEHIWTTHLEMPFGWLRSKLQYHTRWIKLSI